MSARIRYWQISGTNEYIEQIIRLRIPVQHNIEQELTALSYCKDPRTAGSWTDCGAEDEECPYIIQIFPGLPFEFMYELDPQNEKLLFLDCYPLPIFNNMSVD